MTRSPMPWRLLWAAALLVSAPSYARAQAAPPPDVDVSVRPIGRMQLDGAVYLGAEKAMSNGSDLRRARLGVAGLIHGAWAFQLELDMGEGEVEVRDAWVERLISPGLQLRAGVFKEPFSLEELTSSRFVPFQERAAVNALAPGRSIGVAGTASNEMAWASLGLFGQEADELGDSELGDSEAWAVTARALLRRWSAGHTGIQAGFSATRRTPDADEGGGHKVRFRSYPEAKTDRTRFLNTGKLKNTLHHRSVGLEALAVVGPVTLQSEHIRTTVVGADGDASLQGSYVNARWFPLGGGRRYDAVSAELAEVFPPAGAGALEVVARWSHLDLNDEAAGVEGGAATHYTFGAIWHFSPRVQWSLQHVWVDNGPLADADGDFAGDDDFRILTTRLQFWF